MPTKAPPEAELARYYAKFEPALAQLAQALRKKLRARLPGLLELVYMYERTGAFLVTYATANNGASGVCGVALYPDRVTLFFNGGDALAKADAKKLLEGKGKLARHVAIRSLADADRAEIEVLIDAALKIAQVRLQPGARGERIVKAEEQKARARRAAARRTTKSKADPR